MSAALRLTPPIEAAREAIRAAEAKCRRVVARHQAQCKHRDIAECDYEPAHYLSASPPIRICLTCGLTEEGWGCGYFVLRAAHPRSIKRGEIYRLRVGLFITESHRGPLLRRETTVTNLIKGRE